MAYLRVHDVRYGHSTRPLFSMECSSAPSGMKQTQREACGLTRTGKRRRMSAAALFRASSLPRQASEFFALEHNEQGNSRSLLCACRRPSMSCSAWHALLHVKHMSRLSGQSVNALDILTASNFRVIQVPTSGNSRQRSKIRTTSLFTTQQQLPSKQRTRRTKYRYSRPTSRHSGLVLEEQKEKAGKTTRKQTREAEKVRPCVNVACVPSRLHLSLRPRQPMTTIPSPPARLIPPKPLARKHEKNGGNPAWRNGSRYKIRCEDWGHAGPGFALGEHR
ncbi:hypothetical protein HDV57DRAFT_157446 [Trichoderma longibrachiatum]